MNNYLDSYYVVTGLSEETGARVYLAVAAPSVMDRPRSGFPDWTPVVSSAHRFNTLKEITDYGWRIDPWYRRGITDIHTMAIVVSQQLLQPIEFKEQ